MSTTGVKSWSQTAANNASADSTVNWAEGQAPSTVNDSARALMASVAKYRDDIAGGITTGGTSTAYTVTSNQVFQSLVEMDKQVIAFTPHVTCGSTVTLNVDGLGAKPLRLAPVGLAGFPNVELQTGVLLQGTPYAAVYNSTDGAFYLHGFFNNPYNLPVGASLDYWGSSAPNSSFALMYGQAISRTTYSVLFALVGTTYGSGDGSTTFNIPDLRGRVVAGKDDMGGSGAGRLTASVTGTVLGAAGGSDTRTLGTSNLPPYTPSGSITGSISSLVVEMRSSSTSGGNASNTVSQGNGGGTSLGAQNLQVDSSLISASFTGSAQGGTSAAFGIAQPTIIGNKLLRII